MKLPIDTFLKANLTLILKIVTIVTAVLTVFHQDLTIILNDALISESMSYILIIPLLFIYLLYRKRKMLEVTVSQRENNFSRQLKHLPVIAGIILSIAAILFYWHGSFTFTPIEYHMIALPLFAIGLTLILFNPKTLEQSFFPLIFLAFLTPPPSEILYGLGSTLSIVSSQVPYTLINSLGIPSTLTNEYGTPIIQITRSNGAIASFAVDIACSGIYSLIGFIVFAVFVTYIIRDKLWKKLALFITGISLIYLLNITRITTILLIGYYSGEEIALELFHLLGGWFLILIGTFLLLLIAEKIFHTQIFARPTQKCEDCNPKPKAKHNFCLSCNKILKPVSSRLQKTDIIKMAAILVTVILLISIQTPVFALTEGPAQIITQTPTGEQGNTRLLPQIQGYTLEFLYRDKEFEELAKQDASLAYIYQPSDITKDPIWVTIEIGSATSMLHKWEFCLISWQLDTDRPALVTQLDLRDIRILYNPPLFARYFAFQWTETKETQEVLYWFKTAKFMQNGTSQQKIIKISIINYPDNPESINEENLKPFASAIVNYWEPITTWTPIALFLSQNGASLAAVTVLMLLFLIILYLIEKRKQKKANAIAYRKLSEPTKQIIDIVQETQKATTPTLNAIADTYESKTGKIIEKEELYDQISKAEKTGIIKSYIANHQDEPIQIWKVLMLP